MNHLLVLRFSSMGDVAMMIPSIRCLIKKYPETKITVVSKPAFRPFLKNLKILIFLKLILKQNTKDLMVYLSFLKNCPSLTQLI